jgi:hypothetical protein
MIFVKTSFGQNVGSTYVKFTIYLMLVMEYILIFDITCFRLFNFHPELDHLGGVASLHSLKPNR